MTLGSSIISELGARGLRGMFFDFKSYCELKQITDRKHLRDFLDSRRFQDVRASLDPKKVADDLQEKAGSAADSCAAWLLLEPIISLAIRIGLGS
jgi:hypothetical protein